MSLKLVRTKSVEANLDLFTLRHAQKNFNELNLRLFTLTNLPKSWYSIYLDFQDFLMSGL